MLRTFKIGVLTLLLQATALLTAQNKGFVIPDSLKRMSYEELRERIKSDGLNAKFYSEVFLVKSQKDNNIEKISESYHLKAVTTNNLIEKLSYIDKSINATKGIIFKEYPARSYIYRAILHIQQNDYTKSFNNFILALSVTEKNNKELYYHVKYLIGLLKIDIGDYQSALPMFMESSIYFSKESNNTYYLYSLHAISEVFLRMEQLDSCSYYVKRGYEESKSLNKLQFRYLFELNGSIVNYKFKKYKQAIDSLKKSIPIIIHEEDYNNLAVCYYYLGKSYISTLVSTKNI